MIKISLEKTNNKIKRIKINGHALYDDYGKDIVCAAFSSIVITSINGITKIDKNAIRYDEKLSLIEVLNDNEIINTLIDNMISLLKELEHDYPKNVKFI